MTSAGPRVHVSVRNRILVGGMDVPCPQAGPVIAAQISADRQRTPELAGWLLAPLTDESRFTLRSCGRCEAAAASWRGLDVA